MRKRDIFVLLGIVLVIISLYLIVSFTKKPGGGVIVTIDGEVTATYKFSDVGTYELNGGTNYLVIENGYAYVINSTCDNHLCEKQGKISKTGETITCLPNKITITVYGTDSKVDFVS